MDTTIRAWKAAQRIPTSRGQKTYSPQAPLWHNRNLPHMSDIPDYHIWAKAGGTQTTLPIYHTIQAWEAKQGLHCYNKWLHDIGDLNQEKWSELLRHLTQPTIASRDKLIQLAAYWIQIFAFISKVVVLTIPPDPALALLGLTRGIADSVASRILLQLLMYYARKQIILKWNRPDTPTLENWKELVNKALPCYKVAYFARGCTDKFIDIWMIWVLNSETNSPHVF
ncbi:hypothetical protein XELAEV_18012418mg [Xenopus laevis]|uniref:Uncharacterized protein n=1 Tax=Xenopus laevis TaxID=8355 RepID=A0A974HYC5_XENLA|nr:hypothetical protein XELAEV_18012418mg [Xenopus laevis]